MKKGFMNAPATRTAGGRRIPTKKRKKATPLWELAGFPPPPSKNSTNAMLACAAVLVADRDKKIPTATLLRKAEIDNNLEEDTLLNIIRHKVQPSMWDREPVNTDGDNGVFHAWIRKADGSIIDPHFPTYDLQAKMMNCNPHDKAYHEWTEEQQKEKLSNSIPRIMRNIRKNMEDNGLTQKEIAQIFVDKPAFRSCIINAFCYKIIHPDAEIVIGNMGYRNFKTPSLIWWEY